MPVEYADLTLDIQEALGIYQKLKDEWDNINGTYLGKSYAGIVDMFTVLDVPREDWRILFDLIAMIDVHRTRSIKEKTPKK